MMKSIYLLILSIFLFSAQGSFAQNQQGQHPLVGSWTFDISSFANSLEQSARQHLDSLPQVKTTVMSFYAGRRETFGQDGSYSVTLGNGNTMNGSWAIESGNTILISTPGGAIYRKQITFPSIGRMIMIPIDSGESKSMISQLHFIKN